MFLRVLAVSAAAALVMPTAAQLICTVRMCCAPAEMHHAHAPVGDLVTQAAPDDGCMSIGACSVSIPGLTLGVGDAVPSVPTSELDPTQAPGTLTSQPRLLPTPPPRA